MTNSTPNTKALLSAIIGLVAAALIVGAISFGPTLGQSLQGQGLAASSQAREGFVVSKPSSAATTNLARLATTTPPTASTVAANYTVAAVTGEPGDDTHYESEDD
ncbi:MAG: hypothetical protein NTZ81_09660 [Actinobacteria bacterium]|nr:hypothetical protein [Actinomycetota bacterium]